MRWFKIIAWTPILGLALIAILVGACSAEKLKNLEKLYIATLGYVAIEANFCNSAPVVSKQKVKYLFILDKSDSNQPGFPLVPGDASNTDPNGGRRYGPLGRRGLFARARGNPDRAARRIG